MQERLAQAVAGDPDRFVVLGSDYPYDMGMEDPVGFINKVRGLSAADRDRIMGGNAARLLKISPRSSRKGSR